MADDITELPKKIDPSVNILETPPGLSIDEQEQVFLEMNKLVAGGMSVRQAAAKALARRVTIEAKVQKIPTDPHQIETRPLPPLKPLVLTKSTP